MPQCRENAPNRVRLGRRLCLIQALANVLVAHLVAERGQLHALCEARNWCFEETEEQSRQLDRIDHALTALGLFDTRKRGHSQ